MQPRGLAGRHSCRPGFIWHKGTRRDMKERIAAGFGNNIDYEIVWNSEVIEELITRYNIRNSELDVNRVITCERDLVISILSFLKLGSGGERFVSSSEIIEQFSEKFAKKVTLGGT